jgi:hypothetical protein
MNSSPVKRTVPAWNPENEKELQVRDRSVSTSCFLWKNGLQCVLYTTLEKHRNQKAHNLDVVPLVVASNKALVEMAVSRPVTLQDLEMMGCLNKQQSERFGEQLLNVIDSVCKLFPSGPRNVRIERKGVRQKREVSGWKVKSGRKVDGTTKREVVATTPVSDCECDPEDPSYGNRIVDGWDKLMF